MGGGGRGSPQDSGDKRTNGGRAGLSSTAHATAPGRGLACSVLRKALRGALAGNEANPEDPGGPRSRPADMRAPTRNVHASRGGQCDRRITEHSEKDLKGHLALSEFKHAMEREKHQN